MQDVVSFCVYSLFILLNIIKTQSFLSFTPNSEADLVSEKKRTELTFRSKAQTGQTFGKGNKETVMHLRNEGGI